LTHPVTNTLVLYFNSYQGIVYRLTGRPSF